MTFMTFLFISLCYCHKALEWPTCQEEGKVYSLPSQSTITWLAHCFKASGGIGHHSGGGMAPHTDSEGNVLHGTRKQREVSLTVGTMEEGWLTP